MSARKFLSGWVGVLALSSQIHAQLLPQNFSDHDIMPVGYSSPLQDEKSVDLEAQVRRMELRLRELEQDVQQKIQAQPESDQKLSESNQQLTERLGKLEQTSEQHSTSVKNIENTLPNMVFHDHGSPQMRLNGRIQTDYLAFPKVDDTLFPLEGGNPQDRFIFRRARLGVAGDLNDNMFYELEGEFAEDGKVAYRDLFLGFRAVPLLNTVIIGNHKRPYGLDQLNSSRYNTFLERSLITEAFNQEARRIGISSNGYSADQKYNWRYGVWNQQLTQGTAGYIGDHYQLEVAGRIAATPWYDESSGGRGYAHIGLSGSAGVPDGRAGSTNNQARYAAHPEIRSSNQWLDTGAISGANANYLVGLESVINVGAVQLTSEYMRNNVDRRDAVGEDVAFDGLYTQVSYFLTGEHMPWNRQRGTLDRVVPFENFFMVRDCDCNTQRGWGAWQVAARYSHADLTDFDIVGGTGDAMTLGLNWYWNPFARMQFNYILGEIDRTPVGAGDYEIFGVRFMVDF